MGGNVGRAGDGRDEAQTVGDGEAQVEGNIEVGTEDDVLRPRLELDGAEEVVAAWAWVVTCLCFLVGRVECVDKGVAAGGWDALCDTVIVII